MIKDIVSNEEVKTFFRNELKSDKKSLTKISNKYCKKIVKDSNFRKKFYGLYKFLQNRQ